MKDVIVDCPCCGFVSSSHARRVEDVDLIPPGPPARAHPTGPDSFDETRDVLISLPACGQHFC